MCVQASYEIRNTISFLLGDTAEILGSQLAIASILLSGTKHVIGAAVVD